MNRSIPYLFWFLTSLSALALPSEFLQKPDSWFRSAEGKTITGCILSWQSPQGSWPKNQNNTRKPYTGDRSKLKGTFDNSATTGELRYLARAHRATGDEECRSAFLRGYDHILAAQYPNGGWPQFYPPGRGYPRHITFNDGSMVRILEFLRETLMDQSNKILDSPRREAARDAIARGIDCILKCQVRVDGKLTVWCAQHDVDTLAPALARSYELPSLSGSESAGILRFLMKLDDPSDEVIRAVKAGVTWFEKVKIEGVRITKVGSDKKLVPDRSAEPMWARFYEIETARPIFCDRDGVKKYALSDIGKERRNGYAWYGSWGHSVANDFAKWRYRKS
jgi:PelA/Pel-15E family pectate lyase